MKICHVHFNGDIVYSVPEEKHDSVILIDVNFSYLPLLACLFVCWFLANISIGLSADSHCE